MDELIQQANEAGQAASEQTGVEFTPLEPAEGQTSLAAAPVTTESTRPEDDVEIPDAPVTTDASTVSDEIVAESKIQRQLQQERAAREADLEQSRSEVETLFSEITGVQEARVGLEEQAGLDRKSERVTELTNKIEAKELARLREIERIQTQSGLTREQKNARIAEKERVFAREIADLSIAQNAANRDFVTAQNNVDRKINVMLEPLKQQLEFTKFFYEDNRQAFNTAEQREFENLIAEQTREYEAEQSRLQTFEATKLEALTMAASQDAPDSVLAAIQSATTASEAIRAAGIYTGDILGRQLQLEQLQEYRNKNYEFVSQEASDEQYNELLEQYEVGSPEYNRLEIARSAQFDKELDGSQREELQQALSALSTVENLNGLLLQGEDGVNLSGPITGRKRDLLAKLGGDADAAAINATIQGLVPTVARGIFKEVGVLTDTDIENYKKTLPNLTSTEAQNKLISVILMDTLSRSVENTLVVGAKSGQNTSRFLDVYDNVANRVEAEKTRMGVTEYSGLGNDDLLDNIPGTGTATPNDTSEFFNNFGAFNTNLNFQ